MDLLASRMVSNSKTKSKSKKSIKQLSKDDSKATKNKIVSKVDIEGVKKPLVKQKNKNQTEISANKKQLIKDALKAEKIKIQKSSKVKNIKKKSLDILKGSLKHDPPEQKKIKKKISKNNTIENKNTLLPTPKSNDIKSTTKKLVSSGKNKSKSVKSKISKKNSLKTHVELSKEVKGKIVKPEKLKKNETSTKSKKRKLHSKAEEKDTNKLKSSKKLKTEPIQLIKTEDNNELKSIKSKKRKELKDKKKASESKIKDSNLSRKEVINYVKALLKVTENHAAKKKNLFNSDKPAILLVINCVKVPKVPLHQMRIVLPHSLVSSNDDVALFVKDLIRGRRVDYENTVHHYEDILQKHGCTQIKAVIPINQVKTEYRQFEMRRRLLSSYDYFLVDGRISGHMAHLLGKSFRQSRKLPTSVCMDKKDLKTEIDNALHKTSLQIHSTGDSSATQIGNCSMSVEKITDNIMAAIEDLRKNFPGGWNNIRSLRIKTPLSLAIPIYMTLKNKNEVKVPVQTPKRPKAYQDVEGELSTFTSNVKVTVAPDGTVNVQKLDKDTDSEEDSNDSEDEQTKLKNEVKVKDEVKNKNLNEDKKKGEDEAEDEDEEEDESEDDN